MEETVNAQQLKNRIAVLAGEPESMERAAELAGRLVLPLIDDRGHACETEFDLFLVRDRQGLSLQDQQGLSIRGDFTRMLPRLRQANLQNEFLVKASRLKGLEGVPYAVDATAGLGEDSLILAAAGFQVDLYEHNPIIAELLADALERAAGLPELAETVSRMRLHRGSSLEGLAQMEQAPDLVLLDPMFPARQKSGLIKKKLQLLQKLEIPCPEEAMLLQAAIDSHPRKILIKRPLKGPFLAGVKPHYSLKGKAIRYDCLVFARS